MSKPWSDPDSDPLGDMHSWFDREHRAGADTGGTGMSGMAEGSQCPAVSRRVVSGVAVTCDLDSGHGGDYHGWWTALEVTWDYDDGKD